MRNHLLVRASLLPLLVIAAMPANAQTAPAAGAAKNENEIVVTGLRASQQASIGLKREAVNVVDSITTQDIGRLPEQNVAESLQRVPGLTISRNAGDGQFISVRGLGPQFNVVTLNGRTLATDNIGREFSFDILPSELIGGADVYKSPLASLNGASIGATVNIRTLRPLEQKALVLAGSFDMQYDQLPGKWNPRASGVFSWHNQDETLGVSLVASYQKRQVRVDSFDIGAGWLKRSSTDSYLAGRVAPSVGSFTDVWMPSNLSPAFTFSDRERYGLSGTVQIRPMDELTFTTDGFFSHLNQIDRYNAIAYDFSGGTLTDQVIGTGNRAVYQRFTGGFVDQILARTHRDATTILLGENVTWQHDGLTLFGDVSVSRAKRKGNDDTYFTTIRRTNSTLEWDSRTGSPIFDAQFSNPNYANAPTDLNHIGAHYMNVGGTNTTDKTFEAKLGGEWKSDSGAKLSAGVARQNRDKIADTIAQPGASQCAFCGGTTYVPMPSSLFSVTPSNWFPGYGGDTVRQWIQYDERALTQALADYTAARNDPNFVGYQPPVYSPSQSSVVKERVWTGYVVFDLKTEIGGLPLALNTGVRIEDTRFTSNGAAQTIISAVPNGQGQNIITLSPVVPIGFAGHYTDLLPSMNARLDLTDKLLLRFAASRVMSRPTLTDLSPAQTILSNPGNEQITRGNPDLKPFRASQAETSIEWYMDSYSLLSAAAFYKSIDSFVARSTTPQVVDQVTFQVTTPVNGEGATVKGFELSYRQAFRNLPGLLDGLGVQASYTYVASNAHYANQVTGTSYGLEGLSKNSYSLVAFYEKFGIQARAAYTWRDRYLVQANGRNGLPLYAAAYGQLDASISYDVTPHFTLMANAINLNNAKEFSYAAVPEQTFDYSLTGRRFLFGARARF
ncbi:TonB-dependent receptor [Sphingobium sp. Sx8-8]|uniref:TonB-dependent receptor n=1 Tax=Sphingobium sp. Sx8-8 TaxID=2933617 RepID=UPI001F57D5C1|nr:TonB-dependent receptor [Sphingobium sp. Sx8-8]